MGNLLKRRTKKMHLKEYTETDYYGFWPSDDRVKGLEEEYILNERSLAYELDNPSPNHDGLMSRYWYSTLSGDLIYSTIPGGEPIVELGRSLKIKFKLTKEHKYVNKEDYWWHERDPVIMTPGQYAYYMMRCDDEGVWGEPFQAGVPMQPEEKLVTSIFAPKKAEEIEKVNRWSWMAHRGFFPDSRDIDEEYVAKLGLKSLIAARSIAM